MMSAPRMTVIRIGSIDVRPLFQVLLAPLTLPDDIFASSEEPKAHTTDRRPAHSGERRVIRGFETFNALGHKPG